MALSTGATVGPYSVAAMIGEGGMGEVYRARDTRLDRDVALKVLREPFTADPDHLARFQREAKVLASLNHPNIAGIYGLEVTNDTKALVLELVEGPTLADRIKEGPIPVDEALSIATQIAEALDAAHCAGIIHRDLKPANVKLRPDGAVKVLDFGLAKAAPGSDSDAGESPTITAAATATGVLLGTAPYMSPEQAKGKVADRRSDIWAFGCVLYEMLTGRRAFAGDDAPETLVAVLTADVDLDALPPETPARVIRALRACLCRDTKRRVRDIGDVLLAMSGAFDTPPMLISREGATPPSRSWQRPVPLLLGSVALALAAGLVGWNLASPVAPRTDQVARYALPYASDTRLDAYGQQAVTISPDGATVAYNASGSLWLRPLDRLQPTLVRGTDGIGPRQLFFSPDGQWIGFTANGELKKIPAVGGGQTTLMSLGAAWPEHGDLVWGASWGPGDMILVGQGTGGIWRVPGEGGAPEQVIVMPDGYLAHGPRMLPGGEWILFTMRADGETWDDAQIVVQSEISGTREVVVERGRDARYLPTGHLVYAVENDLLVAPFNLDRRVLTGAPVTAIEDVLSATPITGASQFEVARNGSLVYATGTAEDGPSMSVSWIKLGEEIEMQDPPPRLFFGAPDPRFSPDGTRVALRRLQANDDIWIWDIRSDNLSRLTFDPGIDSHPLWTPDGRRVVFYSDRDGGGLFWKAADGSGPVEQLLAASSAPRPFAWTADGDLIFDALPGDIGVLSMTGERTVKMVFDTEADEQVPTLSPDGRWIAYQSDETGPAEIYVRPFPNIDGGKWQVSAGGGVDPLFSPDGHSLYYIAPQGLMSVRVDAERIFTHEPPRLLVRTGATELRESGGRLYDVTPDGQRMLMRLGGPQSSQGGRADAHQLVLVEHWLTEIEQLAPAN